MYVCIPFTGGGRDFRPNFLVSFVRCHPADLHQLISLRSVTPFPSYGVEGGVFSPLDPWLTCDSTDHLSVASMADLAAAAPNYLRSFSYRRCRLGVCYENERL